MRQKEGHAMRRLSDVQTVLRRLRKKYRTYLDKGDMESAKRTKYLIHAYEWVLEIQANPSPVERDQRILRKEKDTPFA